MLYEATCSAILGSRNGHTLVLRSKYPTVHSEIFARGLVLADTVYLTLFTLKFALGLHYNDDIVVTAFASPYERRGSILPC